MRKLLILPTWLVTLSASSQVKMNEMPITRTTKNGYITVVQDGVTKRLPTDSLASMKDLRDSISNSVAVFTARQLGVVSDGVSDQTSKLNSLYSSPSIHKIIFSNGNVKISGKLDAQGKVLSFENGSKLIGGTGTADVLTNAYIEASLQVQTFDTLLEVKDLINNLISVKWFGAIADLERDGSNIMGATDNWTMLNRAMYARKEALNVAGYYARTKVYIPAPVTQRWYYCSKTLIDSTGLEFYGDGELSSIKFKTGIKGIWITGRVDAYYHDFSIHGNYQNQFGTTANDNGSHGIYVQKKAIIERVKIEAFNGDGLHVFAAVPATNANNSTISNVICYNNSGNGFRTKSTDANNITFISCDAALNGIWGVWEGSFLGNSYWGVHTATNASANPWQKTSVFYNGNRYFAIDTTRNTEPGVTVGWQNKWQFMSSGGSATSDFPQWSSSVSYIPGGAYYVDNLNNHSTFIQCYRELDQANPKNDGNALFFGGNTFEGVTGGSVSMQTQRITVPGIGIGRSELNNGRFDFWGNQASFMSATAGVTTPIVRARHTGSRLGLYDLLNLEASNIASNETAFITLGKNGSNYNRANWTFTLNGDNLKTNYQSFGFHGANDLLKIQADGKIFAPFAGVGIGTSSLNNSAVLEVASTTQGFLPPRMTTAQRNAISSPAEGLCIYDLTAHKLYVFDGTKWQAAW
jgi:hypothetical protein